MKRIAFFLPNLDGGGAERVAVNLLKGMSEKNIFLDLVLANAQGPYLNQVPKQVRLINLAAGRVINSLVPLSHYLQQNRPDSLLSHLSHANVIAVLAKKIAGTKTKLVLVEHNTLSVAKSKLFRSKFVPLFMKWLYPQADAIVGVSQGLATDLESQLSFPKGRVIPIYNPVVDHQLMVRAKTPLNHSWFQEGSPPVFLAVGRLTSQKDFLTLIKAFAILRQKRLARLIILGEGESRNELEVAIAEMKIAEDVSLPGFVENPYAYMHNASAFVLSSRWEGLPTVLIEAMACGCPVVATDCPNGPKEILSSGKYGTLIPVGNVEAMSKAMLEVLNFPTNRELLIQRTLDFSHEQAVYNYLTLLT